MSESRKGQLMRILKIIGRIMTVIAIFFVVRLLYNNRLSLAVFADDPVRLIFFLVILSVFSCLQNVVLAYAWNAYVTYFEQCFCSVKKNMGIYLKSIIAKYLPGNVMQYLGRNALAKKWNINQRSISYATFVELGGMATTAVMICLLTAMKSSLSVISKIREMNSGGLALIISVICLVLFVLFLKRNKVKKILFKKETIYVAAKAMIAYIVNFLIAGIILCIILKYMLNSEINPFRIITSNILSWLAGFLVIGSPGGIGIREFVLTLLLKDGYGENIITLAAVILRICAIWGDVLALILGMFLEKDKKSVI